MVESAASSAIREAIRHKGRTRAYLAKEYGAKAFEGGDEKKGKIVLKYLNAAIKKVKAEKDNLSLQRALIQGKNLIHLAERRRMRG